MTLDALRLLDQGVLVAALACFCVAAASLPWVVAQHARLRRRGMAAERELLARPLPDDDALPHVLIQLPTCNDGAVIRRVADACGDLDWPREKLHIQVLDDSTDGSQEIANEAVASLSARGLDAVLLHRSHRAGFKGAALQAGLQHSRCDYIALFDADFVPGRDFLRRCMGALLADPGLAFVQARWSGLNSEENALTRAQQYAIDAYDVVHQTARSWSGYFVQFTGSCAVWRRAAVDALGGWASDILPEDLDVSYRALLGGWRAVCLATVAVPAELPESRAVWLKQQQRWSNGLAQATRKYLPAVWRSDLAVGSKLAASICLVNAAFPPILGAIAVAAVLHLVLGGPIGTALPLLAAIALSEIACAMVGMILAQRLLRNASFWREVPHALAAVSVLLCAQLAGAVSVLALARGKQSVWISTPKRGSELGLGSQPLTPMPHERPSE